MYITYNPLRLSYIDAEDCEMDKKKQKSGPWTVRFERNWDLTFG